MEILIWLFIILVAWLIASGKHGASVRKAEAVRLTPIVTTLTVNDAMDAIVEFANHNGYRVDVVDKKENRMVLSRGFDGLNFGYFFPIHFSTHTNSKTIVEVGIKGKLSQGEEFGLDKKLERCVDGIRSFLRAANKSNG